MKIESDKPDKFRIQWREIVTALAKNSADTYRGDSLHAAPKREGHFFG